MAALQSISLWSTESRQRGRRVPPLGIKTGHFAQQPASSRWKEKLLNFLDCIILWRLQFWASTLPCNGSEGEGTLNAHLQIIRNFSKEGNWDRKELDRIYGIASSGERQGRRGTKRGKYGATDRTKLDMRRASRFPPAGGRGPKGSQKRLLQNIFYCQLPKKTGTKKTAK